jgi:hypothetical protein
MKIISKDSGFVLENEQGASLSLSAQELAELVRDGHRALNPGARFSPIATHTIEDAIVGIDVHHTQAILRLIHEGGTETAFAISEPTTRALAVLFAEKADLIEAAQTKKTEH